MPPKFHVYLDESYDQKCYTVAGVILTHDQSPYFVREWSELLQRFNLKSFHMADYAHGRIAFKGWLEPERQEIMRTIHGIASRRVYYQIGVTMNREGFEKASLRSSAFRALYPDEYTACSLMTAIKVGKWGRNRGYDEAIDYTFDQGNPMRSAMQNGFNLGNRLGLATDYRVGSVTFADDTSAPPLQIADLVAYEAQKFHAGQLANRPRFRYSLQGLLKVPNDLAVLTVESLETLAEKFATNSSRIDEEIRLALS